MASLLLHILNWICAGICSYVYTWLLGIELLLCCWCHQALQMVALGPSLCWSVETPEITTGWEKRMNTIRRYTIRIRTNIRVVHARLCVRVSAIYCFCSTIIRVIPGTCDFPARASSGDRCSCGGRETKPQLLTGRVGVKKREKEGTEKHEVLFMNALSIIFIPFSIFSQCL